MVQNIISRILNSTVVSTVCFLGLALPLATLAPLSANAQTATVAPATAPAAPELPALTPVPAPGAKTAVKAASKEAVENPYGLEALWKTSDWIAKSVLLLLLIMSVASWYILVVKLLEQAKISRQAKAATKDFWSAGTVEQGAAALHKTSPFRFIADAGLEATQKHHGLMGHVPLNDWVTMSIQRAVDRIQSSVQGGLSVLATVGSISPFVGLFGTVWGIYGALTAIGISGQASIDKVAGPVGESLIMTAIGLAVAVPAVLSYNWLVGRNKSVMEDVRAFGSDLHSVILGSAKKA
jgi:biopolymer transport protein ExbB